MKNLQDQLVVLARKLVEAQHDGNDEVIDQIQDEIWSIEEELNEQAEALYTNQHNKQWD